MGRYWREGPGILYRQVIEHFVPSPRNRVGVNLEVYVYETSQNVADMSWGRSARSPSAPSRSNPPPRCACACGGLGFSNEDDAMDAFCGRVTMTRRRRQVPRTRGCIGESEDLYRYDYPALLVPTKLKRGWMFNPHFPRPTRVL